MWRWQFLTSIKEKEKILLSIVHTFCNPEFHNREIVATMACNGLVKGSQAFCKQKKKKEKPCKSVYQADNGHNGYWALSLCKML